MFIETFRVEKTIYMHESFLQTFEPFRFFLFVKRVLTKLLNPEGITRL